MTVFDPRPATTGDHAEIWRQGLGHDPARYLVSDGNLYHRRPKLQSGNKVFIWPVGTEGLNQAGQAGLSIHHYFGDDDADVQIIHKDESRITMTGTFPGVRGVEAMAGLRLVVRDTPADPPGKILYLPGIFERLQYVVVESYDFTHAADDRTHSWDYSIVFVRTGAGKRIKDPHGKPPPPNPGRRVKPRGKSFKTFTTTARINTFRKVARKVYGSALKWPRLMDLNIAKVNDIRLTNLDQGIPNFQIPDYRWAPGTKLFY